MDPQKSRKANQGYINFPYGLMPGMFLVVLLVCGATALTPIAASSLFNPAPTPEQHHWSHAEIPKPAPTATADPTATTAIQDLPSPTASAVETAPLITMTIVDETAINSNEAESPLPANTGEKSILISINEQHLYAYDNGELVYSFTASTGMGHSTRIGTFHVLDKIPNAYGATWNIWMPNWLGIYRSGGLENGIHALPILPNGTRLWAGFLGTPISYGCVVLGVEEAIELYNWAELGTPVEIRW
jgi:lipoprotein-anchoring transpeptidase ErfK/SrfK